MAYVRKDGSKKIKSMEVQGFSGSVFILLWDLT